MNGMSETTFTAIDLYAGAGGWACGLRMAGIDVQQSYEWWPPAARTSQENNRHDVVVGDIRQLDLTTLPADVDYVVGSPPCTEFSYSNKGGGGDIADGLKDIRKFLEIVEHVRPRAWAMENVPRVAKVLKRELSPGGSLAQFADLVKVIEVVDASQWGVPQRRKRMIAGNFNMNTLRSYQGLRPALTLGDVVRDLAEGVRDPVYGWALEGVPLTDHVKEAPLTEEELRMNRDSKVHHRFYNCMPFPEPLDKSARTITALCTRVSRESLIIEDAGQFRRLTVREKASIQAFPVHYQIYGDSSSIKNKQVGNAIPPLLTFYIGHALRGTPVSQVALPSSPPVFAAPTPSATPPLPRRAFRAQRSFAAALPGGLRFGSGTRFQLANGWEHNQDAPSWMVSFHYPPAKTAPVPLTDDLIARISEVGDLATWVDSVRKATLTALAPFTSDPEDLQSLWVAGDMTHGPFGVVDTLGQVARDVQETLPVLSSEEWKAVGDLLTGAPPGTPARRMNKFHDNASMILSGAVVGTVFNSWSEPSHD
jgi:DNA (cytosine-5)-methyltransferase 1